MNQLIEDHGGIGGFSVLCLLFVFSLISIGVMVERLLTLRRIRELEERDYRAMRGALRSGDVTTVRTCAAASNSPVAAAIQAGLESADLGEEKMNDAIDQEVSMQSAELGRNLPTLATIASIAPYVGLFGTVLGILGAFGKIAMTGETGAKAVAGPIAAALVATATGLGVAIPAVMAYNYFSGRVNALGLLVEDHTLDLAARLPELGILQNVTAGGEPRENR